LIHLKFSAACKRQAEGIDKAQARGAYKGRPKNVDDAKVKELSLKGMGQLRLQRNCA
jgi:DNA invertase Pin-like site-specific DNA recombinase